MNYQSRKSLRLKNYDYSSNGYYSITICSKNRKNLFGKYCFDGTTHYIELSVLGQIIGTQWLKIPDENDNVDIDAFVIMPNHIHGILKIYNTEALRQLTGASPVTTVSRVVGAFKSKTSVAYLDHIKQNNLNVSGMIWQRSFYDHVIRDEESLHKIREYIVFNPSTWKDDENNISG